MKPKRQIILIASLFGLFVLAALLVSSRSLPGDGLRQVLLFLAGMFTVAFFFMLSRLTQLIEDEKSSLRAYTSVSLPQTADPGSEQTGPREGREALLSQPGPAVTPGVPSKPLEERTVSKESAQKR